MWINMAKSLMLHVTKVSFLWKVVKHYRCESTITIILPQYFIFVASDGDHRYSRADAARPLVPGFLCCWLHVTGTNCLRHHRLSLPTTHHCSLAVSLLAILLVGCVRTYSDSFHVSLTVALALFYSALQNQKSLLTLTFQVSNYCLLVCDEFFPYSCYLIVCFIELYLYIHWLWVHLYWETAMGIRQYSPVQYGPVPRMLTL